MCSSDLLRRLAPAFAGFAAVAVLTILQVRGVLGAPYEPLAAEGAARSAAAASTLPLYPLSVLNESALFFRYLLLWFVPNPGWMAVDLRAAFHTTLPSWALAGAVAFALVPLFVLWLVRKGGKRAARPPPSSRDSARTRAAGTGRRARTR